MGKWIFLLMNGMLWAACSHIERTPESGYAFRNSEKHSETANSPADSSKNRTAKVTEELGLNSEELQSFEGQRRLQNILEIKEREKYLVDEREKRQYYQAIPWFQSEDEQLEFLQQKGYQARQSWLKKRALGKRAIEIDNVTEDLIISKDIAVGMPNALVRRSWGPPDSIDIAGNSIYGNERWQYKTYAPSPEGYRLLSRVVYFEAGKVVGWEQIEH